MTAIILTVVPVMLMGIDPQPPKGKEPPTTETVRALARSEELLPSLWLLDYGTAAFPACEVILTDPKSTAAELAGVLSFLIKVKAVKGRFVGLATPHLSHKDGAVRATAVGLMGEIGTKEEASILIALLSDEDKIVTNTAATALPIIGGRQEVIAMDAWLRTGMAHRNDRDLQNYVKECRDKLEERLKKNPLPKEIKN